MTDSDLKYATLRHMDEHKMIFRIQWFPFRWEVKCTCNDHYLHQKFSFFGFKKAWEVYKKW